MPTIHSSPSGERSPGRTLNWWRVNVRLQLLLVWAGLVVFLSVLLGPSVSAESANSGEYLPTFALVPRWLPAGFGITSRSDEDRSRFCAPPVGGLTIFPTWGQSLPPATEAQPALFSLCYWLHSAPTVKNIYLVATVYYAGALGPLARDHREAIGRRDVIFSIYDGLLWATWIERGDLISVRVQHVSQSQLARFIANLIQVPRPSDGRWPRALTALPRHP